MKTTVSLTTLAMIALATQNVQTGGVASQQIVTPSPATQSASTSQSVDFDVIYSTNPTDQTLTGLGLRIHYDSSQLSSPVLSSVLITNLIQQGTPVPDTSDFDGNANTDMFIVVAWADITGGMLARRRNNSSHAL